MKRKNLAILLLLCSSLMTEVNAQRRAYRHRHYARPHVRVMPRIIGPRIVIPPPAIGLSWGYSPRVYIIPPPIILGGGNGWRHYHRRGHDCNNHCRRWRDDHDYNERNRRYYDDKRERRYYDEKDYRYDEENRNRRYRDYDHYYNRLEDKNQSPLKEYNTDEDMYEEEIKDI